MTTTITWDEKGNRIMRPDIYSNMLQELMDQKEQMQDDVSCILDGIEDDDVLLNSVNDMIVERMNILIDKLRYLTEKT